MARGALIVFEGCDRAGKTTQAKHLLEFFKKGNVPASYMRFPDRTTQIGKVIDGYLQCRDEVEDHTIHLLFSANRWENVKKMKKMIESGTTVIVDRYAFSGVAFSASKEGLSLDWCKQCDVGLPKPDVVFFFELSLEEAKKRGGFGDERYEREEFQQLVVNTFHKLRDSSWKVIDASRELGVVSAEVEDIAMEMVESVADTSLGSLWARKISS